VGFEYKEKEFTLYFSANSRANSSLLKVKRGDMTFFFAASYFCVSAEYSSEFSLNFD
jgi:hypothetical protein